MADNAFTADFVAKQIAKVRQNDRKAPVRGFKVKFTTVFDKSGNPIPQNDRQEATIAPPATIATPVKASKHRNKKASYKGFTFDSAKELARYQALELLQQAGAILDLARQQSFDLYACNGERIARYVSDFTYYSLEYGKHVIEDSKSEWTRRLPVYRLKAKLMAAQGTPITEV